MTEQTISFNDERNNTAHRPPNETISGSISGSSRIGGSTTMNQRPLRGYLQSHRLHVNPLTMYRQNFMYRPYGNDNTRMASGEFPSTPSPNTLPMFGGQPFSAAAYTQVPSMLSPNSRIMFGGQPVSATDVRTTSFGYFAPHGHLATRAPSVNTSHGFNKIHGQFVGSSEQVPNQSNSLDFMSYLSPVEPGPIYQQPMGNVMQAPMQGIGNASNTLASKISSSGVSQSGGSSYNHFGKRNKINVDKERDSISSPSECVGSSSDKHRGSEYVGSSIDRNGGSECIGSSSDMNRGSSSSKSKNKNSNEDKSIAEYNRPDFPVEYENAKFYVIKPYCEANVHRSIKYRIWNSSVSGNTKLSNAYSEAKNMSVECPVFLFFSVIGSEQFCGVAEMVGVFEYERDNEYGERNMWIGQFPVKWHIIKYVPETQFRHLLVENGNPVTSDCEDTQEVKLELGIQMLKIFKEYERITSILDKFPDYNDQETVFLENLKNS